MILLPRRILVPIRLFSFARIKSFVISAPSEPPVATLTTRLRLVPIDPEHVADLVTIDWDPWIAQWYAGLWPAARAD
jgi:hypothetical protein